MTTTRTRAVAAGGATLIAFGAGLVLAPLMATAAATTVNTSPDLTLEQSPDHNSTSWWESEYDADCTKIENSSSWDGDVYTLGSAVDILVLKSSAGSDANSVWFDAAAGMYGVPDGQDISHIIVCDIDDEESATPTPTETETETATPTPTGTETATPTPTETETATPTPTETVTDPATPTPTETTTTATPTDPTDPATTASVDSTPTSTDPAQPELASTGAALRLTLVGAGLALLLAGAALLGLGRRSGTHA